MRKASLEGQIPGRHLGVCRKCRGRVEGILPALGWAPWRSPDLVIRGVIDCRQVGLRGGELAAVPGWSEAKACGSGGRLSTPGLHSGRLAESWQH